MRFGVMGLGSMGKRRVRDLRALGHDVVGYDLRMDRNAEATSLYGIETVDSADSLVRNVDAVVVSTPPDQHVPGYELCFRERRPFFSEASIFTPRAEWFADRELLAGVRGYPSATWTFYPLLKTLQERVRSVVEEGVLSVHHHYAGWLPYWHPWEQYTEFYAGQRSTSAAREMVPFEMEWLCWLFGPVHAVTAMQERRMKWESDIDDHYSLLLEFERGTRATLVIELHQVAPFREARVSTSGHSFRLDFGQHVLDAYERESDTWQHLRSPGLRTFGSFDFEDVYLAEIRAFAEAVEEGAPPEKSWAEDRHLSNVLFAAEESARRRGWVEMAEAEALYDGLRL